MADLEGYRRNPGMWIFLILILIVLFFFFLAGTSTMMD